MTPAEIDLTIYQGATFRRTFQWKTGSPATPVDLTGYTARMQIRKKVTDATPVLTLTSAAGGITFTNRSQGQFEIVISADATAALTIKTGVYDLELIAANNEVTRLIQGTVEVSPEVTRS